MIESPKILIAGASGYIGKALLPKLLEKFPSANILALSRIQQKSNDSRVSWKACDLFSLKSIEEAVPPEIDIAIYLVHSMGPTAQLDQGSFADYDLLLADNFARVLQNSKIKQLIYLGGLIPDSPNLSLHLQSRLEVEEIFSQYQLPTTVFRAGLVLGSEGSSFQILLKLVKRLPLMICPRWTQTLTTPVDLNTVINSISHSALNNDHLNRTYDLAGCQPITYLQMMKETARKLKLKRFFLTVPFFTPTLSRLWVRLITNSSKGLVYPLVESLEHTMVARETNLFSKDSIDKTYYELLESAFFKSRPNPPFFNFSIQRKTVRSVQRFVLPENKDAIWVKDLYMTWLPKWISLFIKVKSNGSTVTYSIRGLKIKLLVLQINLERSSKDRQLYYISEGLLVSGEKKGRLEFRVVLNRRYILTAIHDYKPALPWIIYKFSQAWIHLLVMNSFGKYLDDTYS